MQTEIENLLDNWGQKRGKIDLSLDRILKFLKTIGSPHLKIPPVIHVAGTNGKGSTIAFLKAIIEADGKSCHVYTSPHLVKFNERVVLNGEHISDAELLKLLQRIDSQYKAQTEIELTFFELTTIAAFTAFASSKADYVLLETGMGGRYDATNIIDSPLLTIITPISIDHTEYLGDKIQQIASEKAGIIKPGVVCISAPQNDQVKQILEQTAAEKNSQLEFATIQNSYGELALKGQHQEINASVASVAARILGIHQQAVFDGLKSAKWPGRLQKLEGGELVKLLPPGFELWLDGAHNIAGAEALSFELAKIAKPKYMILGMLDNRDPKEFLSKFKDIAKLNTIPIPNQPTAHESNHLADCGNQLNIKSEAFENVYSALKNLSQNPPGNIYICGSLYLVGSVLKSY